MKKGINPKSNLKVTGIAEYIRNKAKRKEALFTITPTGSFYFHEGERMPESEFNNLYPVELKPVCYKGENCDGTKVK